MRLQPFRIEPAVCGNGRPPGFEIIWVQVQEIIGSARGAAANNSSAARFHVFATHPPASKLTWPGSLVSCAKRPGGRHAMRRRRLAAWQPGSAAGVVSAAQANVSHHVLQKTPDWSRICLCLSWRIGSRWAQKELRVCCGEISDQRDGSGRNMIGPVALSPNVRAPFNAKRTIWQRRRRHWISDVFVSAEEFSLHRILLEKCESAALEKKN